MFVSGDRRYKVFVVSLFYLKHITAINLGSLTALTLFYKDNCNSAPSPNICTILSALHTSDLFFEIIHRLLQKEIIFFLKSIQKKRPTMGILVILGLGELLVPVNSS